MQTFHVFHGVNATIPAEELDGAQSPWAANLAQLQAPGGDKSFGRRPGLAFLCQTSATSGTTITAQAQYQFYTASSGTTAGTWTQHHIGILSDGTLWNLGASTSTQLTISTSDYTGGVLLGASSGIGRFAQAQNALFGTTGLGEAFKVYRIAGDSTIYVRKMGLAAPSVAPTLDSSATSGDCTGTFEFAAAWYNTNLDSESSLGPTLTVGPVTSKRIDLSLSALSPPTDATHLNVYVRKTDLMTSYLRNTAMRVAIANLGVILSIDLTDAELNALILEAPDTEENNPPPSHLIDLRWHLSRMFATDGSRVYYSKVGHPEAFDPDNYELVGAYDGQRIMGLAAQDETTLVIFKERCIYVLLGDAPSNWQIRVVDETVGCTSTPSICQGEGLIAFWSRNGPWIWSKDGSLRDISQELVQARVRAGTLTLGTRNAEKTAWDPVGRRFLFAPNVSDRWTLLPFRTDNAYWECSGWDVGTIASMTTLPAQTGQEEVFLALSDRVIASLRSTVVADLLSTTTPNATLTISTATTSTVVVTAAPTIESSYAKVCSVIDTATGEVHRSAYTRSGTTLTLTTAFSAVPSAGFVTINVPVVEWYSRKEHLAADPEQPNARNQAEKRLTFAYGEWDGTGAGMLTVHLDGAFKRGWTWSATNSVLRGRIAAQGREIQLRLIAWGQNTWQFLWCGYRGEFSHDRW